MKKFYLIFALFTLVSITVTSQPQLTWRFANVEVINAGTQLQFDVEVKASVAGSFQRDLQIYFDYSTLGFGSNIVANSKITYTPLALLNISKYVVVNMADNTSSKFAIITEGLNEMTQPGNATYFSEITTSYQGLLKFTINITPGGNTQTAGIAFDQTLMNGGQYYQSLSNTDPIKYADAGLYENNLSTLKLSSIYGTITYNNTLSTPMKLCNLTLSPGGDTYGPTLNDGKFYFTGMVDGPYTIATTCTNTWGGLQNLDATFASRYILGLQVLTALQQKAADVNMSGTIQTLDVTMMKRRLVGQTYPSWTAPAYVFLATSATVASGIGTVNYKGVCSGDVNGSWTPPTE